MKIIFAGTTAFGIPTLEKLKAEHQLDLIITQPDRPVGRNQILAAPPIKIWAHKHNIPVLQPARISEIQEEIARNNPDLLLVAAYGQIIPKTILDIPKFGSINIHGSLLPKHRGASPIQAAILNGDTETGITLILMDEQMDHGPIIAKEVVRLTGNETYPALYAKLSQISAELVLRVLPGWFDGNIKPADQIHAQATYTKLLGRQDAKLDWTQPAKAIDQKIRALNPEPGTWTILDGKIVKIIAAKLLKDSKIELPGKIYSHLGQLAVKCLDASIIVTQIQPEGRSVMNGNDFLNGLKSSSRIFI